MPLRALAGFLRDGGEVEAMVLVDTGTALLPAHASTSYVHLAWPAPRHRRDTCRPAAAMQRESAGPVATSRPAAASPPAPTRRADVPDRSAQPHRAVYAIAADKMHA